MTKLAVVLCAALAAPAVLASHASAEPQDRPTRPGDGEISGGSRGYLKAPPEAFIENHGPTSHIIYLNRCIGDCTFTKAEYSDAITNSTIIGGSTTNPFPLGATFVVHEFAQSEQVWQDTLRCVREVYAPFDVQIVIEDPGNVPHHEAVVAGTAMDIGRPGVLGVAPLEASTCEPKNNVISFSLANDHPADGLQLCWTIAQESAHSFGLDHGFECTDPMTYIGNPCGQKFFRNLPVPCGENAARQCLCTGTVQNSHAKLLSVHGANPVPPPAPATAITSPANGAMVTGQFSVIVNAIDKRGVARLELYVNGWKWTQIAGSRTNTAYVLSLPPGVPDGVMDVKVRACNDIDRCGEQTVTVTRGAACASEASCLAGQKCEAGKCFWDPPSAEVGDACTYDQQCLSTTCQGLSDGSKICTKACVGGPNDDCDEGFTCSGKVGANGFCLPAGEDGGCCSAGGAARSGTGGVILINLGLGAVVGLLIVRRRRRRA